MIYKRIDFEKVHYTKRKIFDKMLKWKEDSAGKTAMLIDGAGRVGKSYIAEEFAKENYKSYILIDFNRAGDEVKDLFSNSLNDLDSFFMYLSAIYGVTLYDQSRIWRKRIGERRNI